MISRNLAELPDQDDKIKILESFRTGPTDCDVHNSSFEVLVKSNT